MARRKRPSMYRFLKPAVMSWGPMMGVVGGQLRVNAVCDQVKHLSATTSCPSLPAGLISTAWVAVAIGVVWSAYLFYRDFVRGHYWMDLDN